MKPLLRIINPNSTTAITDRIAEALAPCMRSTAIQIDCVTLADGPPGVASDADIAQVIPLVTDRIANDDAAAFVIACYSDPGLGAARKLTNRPVIGIGEAAIATAMTIGDRFGIISVSDWSVKLHARDMKNRNLHARCAGDRPLGLDVAETENAEAFDRIADVGHDLLQKDGADVLITACAGMSRHLLRLEGTLGCPVVDPVRAAAAIASGILANKET